jgi:ABC-2 type transport system ATP-binding protein
MSEAAISVRGLRKSYCEHEAVAGIDFEVAEGEVFGFLGPNGAGKTTTIEILEGYRERSGVRSACSASIRVTRRASGAAASAWSCRSASLTRF